MKCERIIYSGQILNYLILRQDNLSNWFWLYLSDLKHWNMNISLKILIYLLYKFGHVLKKKNGNFYIIWLMRFPGIDQAGAYLAHSSVSAIERTSE